VEKRNEDDWRFDRGSNLISGQ